MTYTSALILLSLVGLALAIVFLPLSLWTEPVTRDITMTADQFAYDPSILRVNRGDQVRLNLKAADVVHGFYLDGYDLEVRVEPGLSQQVEFVADRAGKFRYRCSVSCGSLHPFMIGELVVAPNLMFARAVGLTLVVLAATLYSLWRFPPREAGI